MNENALESTAAELRQAITDFLVPLQTTRVVNKDAFARLFTHAQELMPILKEHELVPKSLLNELYRVPLVILAEAPYFKDESEQLDEMAHKIGVCFSRILKGEVPEDRIPGVPRLM
ncbi:MAG: hypothetical protein DHS20C16_12860 [Phycisphaerae bacterium]|nr:MAG: hypothetical protein DHS20C16_12860 [Phycisphaerae bacterium]